MWVTYYNNRPGCGKSTNQQKVRKELTMPGKNVTVSMVVEHHRDLGDNLLAVRAFLPSILDNAFKGEL